MERRDLDQIVYKSRVSSKWFSVGGILLVAFGMTFYYFKNRQLNEANKLISDSLVITNKLLVDTTMALTSDSLKRDTIKGKLVKYFSSDPLGTKNYKLFYTDTLTRFFLRENVLLSDILEKKMHLSPKNTPRSKLEYNIDKDLNIDLSSNDTFQIYANVRYYYDSLKPAKNIIYQLKMNDKYKIFYVRNLLPQ